jgi:hypothetical protein
MSPRYFVGRPRYSTSPRERAMGNENSGKKSPGVTIFPFALAPAGMKQTAIKRKKTAPIIHLFIATAPFGKKLKISIRDYRRLSTGFKSGTDRSHN